MSAAVAELTLPPLPDAFVGAADPDAAARALVENGDANDGAELEPVVLDKAAEPKRGRGRPPKSDGVAPVTEPVKLSKRAIQRMTRVELRRAVLSSHERATAAESRVAELTAEVTARSVVSADVVDSSVNDMVGEVLELLDSGAQLAVSHPKLAAAVALEDDERKRLTALGARVAKLKLGAHVEQSPMIALGLGVAAVLVAKVLAYRMAQADLRDSSPSQ